jgi:ABC-type transport system involved in cytochrome bd biosynthesis fused ATPase/permease subunit
MLNVIESINSHAQFYLDYFFPDNPIVVNLSAFKETKKSTNKSQINVEIHYKSMECDLDSLSGGELSRVILCFTLALGEMSNCPLLMLDESTASLDQDSTTIVFDTIKEHFKGKIVLVVAHQVTEGIFDKVIKL